MEQIKPAEKIIINPLAVQISIIAEKKLSPLNTQTTAEEFTIGSLINNLCKPFIFKD